MLAHARGVLAASLVLTLLLGSYAVTHLGVNMDHTSLVSPDLPYRKTYAEFAEQFPILDDAILAVVDAETPELARDATARLEARLAARDDVFREVFVPGGGSFFERNALLYLDVAELEEFVDHLAGLQPVIAELDRDPSIGNLARLVQRGVEQAEGGSLDVAHLPAILDRVSEAMVTVYAEHPISVSWESFLLEGSSIDPVTRRVIVLEPVLDTDRLLPAGRAMAAIRSEAAALGLASERGVQVRLTGNPALNHEEMLGLFWDVAVGGLVCLVLVTFILWRAFRSIHLVAAAVLTLAVGLVWTAAFAAASIGHINLVSIAFAILFIGLGVDFAIHLGMRYADVLREGVPHEQALRDAVADVGGSLVLCTVSTAIGFYVFVPTDNMGVAELGLISGTGMALILVLTLTLFPALVHLGLRPPPGRGEGTRAPVEGKLFRALGRHPRGVLAVAGALFAGALVLAPQARFSSNVVQIRDSDTESVQAMNDLLADANASPWYIDVLASDLEATGPVKRAIEALPQVRAAVALDDFVPDEQGEKLAILEEAAFLMDTPPANGNRLVETLSPAEQVAALRELHRLLDAPWLEERGTTLARSVQLLRDRLGEFLDRAERNGDPSRALANLEHVLLGGLPEQISRLRASLEAERVTLADLPPSLVERMRARDGRARIQVFPVENVNDEAALARFVEGVRSVWPDATGLAVNFFEFGKTTAASMREALVYAGLAIAALLWLLWRSLSDTAIALAPLVLGTTLAVACTVLMDLPFNFVNVVVLPLLLGIGVDSGIHLVHRAKAGSDGPTGLLGSTTARAVFWSAITTSVSFGSLALSGHRGMHSMGLLLLVGVALILTSNLVVLPALLAVRAQRRARRSISAST